MMLGRIIQSPFTTDLFFFICPWRQTICWRPQKYRQ